MKPQAVIRFSVSDPRIRNLVGFVSHPGMRYIFGIHLIFLVHELLFISDDFHRNRIMGIQRNICTVASLMKQNLRNQIYADISMIGTSCKQVTNLLGIDAVQQIV